jgi:hypothetical protein
MPRGQYDRAAAAARRAEGATAKPKSRIAVERGEDWADRARNIKGHLDYFDIIRDEVPDDASYEWKRFSVYGKDETQYQAVLRENGWTPVPSERHPILPGVGGCIIHEGLMLMERPKHLTEEAREEDDIAAQNALRMQTQKAGSTEVGQLDRIKPRVNIERQLMPIDNDA